MASLVERWTQRAHQLKTELAALAFAARDPRVPWTARLLAGLVAAYAFSPIDLIPDPIPVLGYLDDLILIPLGIALVLRLIPPEVMAEARQRARSTPGDRGPARWIAAAIIVLIWIALLLAALKWLHLV